jgi:steroid 5-alpha reductase family enzyme
MDAVIFAWAAIGPVVSLILALPITIAYKDNSLVDIGWALGFMVTPWIGFILNYIRNDTWSIRQLIINVLIIIWGIRLLTYYIVRKRIRKLEDKRFAKYREQWQKNFILKSFLVIFVPQMFLVYIIGSPALFANTVADPFIPDTIGIVMLIIGGIIWLQGFIFETVGDIQLLNFRKNPENKGKILSSGLWRYTRHPNYWGEATQWWGIFLMAIPMAFLNMNDITQIIVGCVTVFGPILLTFTLLKFSGIPTIEKEGILKGREGYEEYIETTSAFIPWFPKKKKNG